MVTLAAALILGSTWAKTPSDDVWVYPHSSDPGAEQLLRVWGDGEVSVDANYPPDGSFSYAYVQWDISDLPKGDLEGATLTVYALWNEELSAETVEKFPLEIRALKPTLDEKRFSYDKGEAPAPKALAKGKAEKVDKNWKFTFDLNDKDGKFKELLAGARDGGKIAFAFTSKISPAESRSLIYKINSKEGPKELRPELKFEIK